eukprot:NODE_13672_length_1152_cov_8.727805.p2 GENE.NODE_13672_length_1152_cov_8.727805~~NODE_13672_length_1152_cov_8.727805.p2  ORF type:complete len:98 (+),score=6.53 NODE_13672_length_1152_cov_8.727805:356-649(+)
MARRRRLDKRLQEWSVVISVVRPEHALHVLRHLHRVVAGKLWEEMVHDVGGSNVVEDPVEAAVGAVHRAECAFEPRPLVVAVVWDLWVRMAQPSNQN